LERAAANRYMTLSYIDSDLSKINCQLTATILEGFNHPNEEVKSAASYALGKISLGNLKEFLPFVLKEIETQPKKQYLLLHSLKEVRSYFSAYIQQIIFVLLYFR
jgi:hypothetical protein